VKNLLQDKRIIAGGIIVLLLLVGGYFFLFNKQGSSETPSDDSTSSVPIPTITAEDLGLTLEPGSGGKTVIVTVTKPEGIDAIEYDLSYTSEGDIPRGAIGQLDVTKKPVRKEITLGTCSDTCHYDKGVKDIKIVLKITKDGKTYQSEKKLASVEE
jgi:hypothetical protein